MIAELERVESNTEKTEHDLVRLALSSASNLGIAAERSSLPSPMSRPRVEFSARQSSRRSQGHRARLAISHSPWR